MAAAGGAGGGGALRFPAFLPGDDVPAGGAGAPGGAGAGALAGALGALLQRPPGGFWEAAVHSRELGGALDSFLRFRRRAVDGLGGSAAQPAGGGRGGAPSTVEGAPTEAELLARRVFAVFLRLVEGDSAAAGGGGGAGPGLEERGQLLRDLGLLDAPRALDLCALFEPANPELCQRLMRGLLVLRPDAVDDFALAFDQLTELLNSLRPLKELGDDLAEVRGGGPGRAPGKRPVGSSTSSSSGKRPVGFSAGSSSGKRPVGSGSASGSGSGSGSGTGSRSGPDEYPWLGFSEALPGRPDGVESAKSAAALRYALDLSASLSALLRAAPGLSPAFRGSGLLPAFQLVYEEDLPALVRAGLGGACVEALEGGIQELMWVVLGGFLEPPPYAVSAGGSSPKTDTEERGEELVGFLMSLPDPSGEPGRGLLASLQRVCGLVERVQEACRTGHIRIDDAQLDYLGHILGAPVCVAPPVGSGAGLEAEGGAAASTLAAPSDVVFPPEVASIQDILPGYGAGFLAACLEEYGNNQEHVIQHLLEGSLSPYLQTLDTAAERKPPKPASAASRRPQSAAPTGPSGGPAQRNRRVDWKSARVLEDRKDFSAAIRSQAIETQYEFEDEYDDEYDDSYDALGGAGGGRLGGTTQDEREDLTRPGGARKTFWILSGRVYNFPKEGSKEILAASSEEAGAVAKAEVRAEREAIHGRGAARDPTGGVAGTSLAPRGGKVRQQRGAPGGSARDRAYRDKNKARFANHSRKDRAAKKQGGV